MYIKDSGVYGGQVSDSSTYYPGYNDFEQMAAAYILNGGDIYCTGSDSADPVTGSAGGSDTGSLDETTSAITSADISGSDTHDYMAFVNAMNEYNTAAYKQEIADYERLRSTAYQTAVEDMKKAGLNPALMYANGGSGISTAMPSSARSSGNSSYSVSGMSQDTTLYKYYDSLVKSISGIVTSAIKAVS